MSRVSRFTGCAAALVAAMSVGAGSASAELLTNPGFETGGTGWGSYGAAGFNAFFGANGHASLFMDNPGNFGGVFQTGIPANAGDNYTFTLTDVRIESNAAASLRFGLEWYQGDDTTAAGPFDIVNIPIPPTGDGLSFTMSATAPAGAFFVRPIIQFDNVTSTASDQENAFIFDATLTPEPASLGLCAVGGLAMLVRRR